VNRNAVQIEILVVPRLVLSRVVENTALAHSYIHTYHLRFFPEAETSQIFLRDTYI
jgi:hypothetical protein